MNRMKVNVLLLTIFTLVALIFVSTIKPVQAGQHYDLSSSTNWNIRIDGADANDILTLYGLKAVDLNNNGYEDLIIGAYAGYNTVPVRAGSVYIIYDSILRAHQGVGQVIDLGNSQNWNVKFEGAEIANEYFGMGLQIGDLNNNGSPDIVIGNTGADNNGRTDSGSVYVIFDEIYKRYSGVGNVVDTTNSNNYTLRFDGEVAGDRLSYYGETIKIVDMDGDNRNDLLLGTCMYDYSGRSNSGAIHFISNTKINGYSTQNVDLLNAENYDHKLVGAVSGALLGYGMSVGDIDNNGRSDLLAGSPATDYNSKTDSGSVYVIYDDLFDSFSSKVVDMNVAANYNYRFDGAEANHRLSFHSHGPIADLNDNQKGDLIFSASYATYLTRSHSGWYYLVYDDIVSDKAARGVTKDMSTESNYSLMIPFYSAHDYGVQGDVVAVADYDSDSRVDLVVGAIDAPSYDGTLHGAGSFSVIPHTTYLGATNKLLDLAEERNFTARYYGPKTILGTTGPLLGEGNLSLVDLNGDLTKDIVVGAIRSDYNDRAESGSAYIIYNFPHSITAERDGSSVSGTISAKNSITAVARVQYSVDNNSMNASWKNCTGTTSFTCPVGQLSNAIHRVYIRAQDVNGVYTARSKYYALKIVPVTVSSSRDTVDIAVTPIATTTVPVIQPSDTVTPIPSASPTENIQKRQTLLTSIGKKAFSLACCPVWIIFLLFLLILFWRKRKKEDEE